MSPPPSQVVLRDESHRGPEAVPLPGWEVVAFSACSPARERNEDAALVVGAGESVVLAVADGMGGHQDGARASKKVVGALAASVEEAGTGSSIRTAVMDGIEQAHRAVVGLGTGAGSTLSTVVLAGGTLQPFHVGDSMILLVGQRGRVKFDAVAHSPTGYAVEAGLLDEAEALVHDDRHLVSNYVGYEGMSVEVGAPVAVGRRDTLVVASDGLADNLTTDEIVELVRKGPLLRAAERLAEAAGRRMRTPGDGGPCKPDDLTFLLVRRSR